MNVLRIRIYRDTVQYIFVLDFGCAFSLDLCNVLL